MNKNGKWRGKRSWRLPSVYLTAVRNALTPCHLNSCPKLGAFLCLPLYSYPSSCSQPRLRSGSLLLMLNSVLPWTPSACFFCSPETLSQACHSFLLSSPFPSPPLLPFILWYFPHDAREVPHHRVTPPTPCLLIFLRHTNSHLLSSWSSVLTTVN